MTMTVLLIAALHALPVVLVGIFAQREQSLNTTAIAMGIISILYGSPAYALFDLLAVGGAWLAMRTWRESNIASDRSRLPPGD